MSARGVTSRLLGSLLELLAPSICLACPRTGAGALGLCAVCRGRVRPLRPPLCRTCARPLPLPEPARPLACGACRRRETALDRLVSVWVYAPPLDRVLQALKYERLEYLGKVVARAMLASGLEPPAADQVVPVPLHWRRRMARGYNQAELLARPLAAALGLPLVGALSRPRPTAPQARLGLDRAERRAHLAGAFRPRRRRPVAGRRVLLVDDVVTTGATLEAAAAALAAAGAAGIAALTAARTPAPGESGAPLALESSGSRCGF